ncbi:hypothetical protein Cgig2_026114 [Carnegiea gigantea]|uniref:Uncharacterized protein n=1 Tax=Carnegiea gigantea TaxID=171969 RepID=A0A9Q1GQC3_9CARY|nr:hypothetical protein Cgig2_026114 [Carnegiea gigantea]
MAAADSHLENGIFGCVLYYNEQEPINKGNNASKQIFLHCICLCESHLLTYTAILHAQKTSFKYQEFYKNQLASLEYGRFSKLLPILSYVFTNPHIIVDVLPYPIVHYIYSVFLPILRSEHFFLVIFQFAYKTVNIIDNLTLPENPSTRYGNYDTLLLQITFTNAETLLLKGNINLHDCEIYIMRHMETYYGDLQSWDDGFQKEREALLRTLRAKYASRILLYLDNMLRDNTLRKGKLEAKARQQ